MLKKRRRTYFVVLVPREAPLWVPHTNTPNKYAGVQEKRYRFYVNKCVLYSATCALLLHLLYGSLKV